MSRRSDHYGDETHPEKENTDRRATPYYPPWGWGGTRSFWPFSAGGDEETRYDETAYESADDGSSDKDGNESYWDEGLLTLLIGGGAILFLIPEPATSGLGILLMAAGVIGWIIDWTM